MTIIRMRESLVNPFFRQPTKCLYSALSLFFSAPACIGYPDIQNIICFPVHFALYFFDYVRQIYWRTPQNCRHRTRFVLHSRRLNHFKHFIHKRIYVCSSQWSERDLRAIHFFHIRQMYPPLSSFERVFSTSQQKSFSVADGGMKRHAPLSINFSGHSVSISSMVLKSACLNTVFSLNSFVL